MSIVDRVRIRRGVLRWLSKLPIPTQRSLPDQPMRILIIRPDDLGDLVLASPAIQRLRDALPGARITLAVGPWAAAAVPFGPQVDDTLTIPFPGVSRSSHHSRFGPYTLLVKQSRRLRAARYDAALVLRRDHWWGAMLTWAAGIPRRVGYALPEVAAFCTETLPPTSGVHATIQSLALVDAFLETVCANDPVHAPLVFRVDEKARSRATSLLGGLPSTGLRIGIHPGAGSPIKQWPIQHWIAVARAFAADGIHIVLTGGANEANLTARIADGLSDTGVLDLAGLTDLGSLAAIFAQCDMVVGVDSGALHVATAVAPRTLRIYGPSDPVQFGPWGDSTYHQALTAGLRCPLCGVLDRTTPCALDCLGALAPDEFSARAMMLLSTPSQPATS